MWIRERLDNCHAIAATKTGKDRDGWLRDAAQFAEVLDILAREEATLSHLSDATSKFANVAALAATLDAEGEKCAALAPKAFDGAAHHSLSATATAYQECAGRIREALK